MSQKPRLKVSSIVKNHLDAMLSHLALAKEFSLSGQVSDVVNGTLYESFGENPKHGVLTINLIVNADGARPLHASTGSLWPCDAVVAELPQMLRYKFENCIVLAMWHGCHKPIWKILLQVISSISQFHKFMSEHSNSLFNRNLWLN
jgi:hypothetical protein